MTDILKQINLFLDKDTKSIIYDYYVKLIKVDEYFKKWLLAQCISCSDLKYSFFSVTNKTTLEYGVVEDNNDKMFVNFQSPPIHNFYFEINKNRYDNILNGNIHCYDQGFNPQLLRAQYYLDHLCKQHVLLLHKLWNEKIVSDEGDYFFQMKNLYEDEKFIFGTLPSVFQEIISTRNSENMKKKYPICSIF